VISEKDCKTLTVHGTRIIQEWKQDGDCSRELSGPTYSLAQHSKGRTYVILGYKLQ